MRRPYRSLIAQHLVVNLDDGTALDGYLDHDAGPLLFLQGVTVHEPGIAPAPADGTIVVERDRIRFIQAVTDTRAVGA